MPYTILYYTDCKSFGGAEQYLLTVLKKIDRDLWRPVVAYHPSAGNSSFVDEVKDLKVDLLSVPGVRSYTDFKRIFQFTGQLKSLRPTIFHANLNWPLSCTYGIVAALIAGVKIIVATQHLYVDARSRRNYLIQKIISSFVNRYIAVSSDIARHMKELISSTLRVDVIHNGIIIENYDGLNNKEMNNDVFSHLRSAKNLPIILTVARLHKHKGHTYLLEAATMIHDAIFVLAGEGPERSNLENYARELNVDERVIFLGHRDDIPSLINGCNLFVLPSLFEGLPLTIMEVMAAGKPIIASNISGIDEIINDGETGFLVPAKNPEALSSAIQTCISNPDLTQKVAQAGKIRVQQEFSAEIMVKRITKLYDKLIRNGG